MLDFYAALFERSAMQLNNAMAAALNTFYTKRGFYFLNEKVRHLYFHLIIAT